jgi:hypothetical protein
MKWGLATPMVKRLLRLEWLSIPVLAGLGLLGIGKPVGNIQIITSEQGIIRAL